MECDNSVNPVGNRPRLLVAEDNPSNFKLVEVLLRRDYELVHAWDGRQAVDMFAEVHPDLERKRGRRPVFRQPPRPGADGHQHARHGRL